MHTTTFQKLCCSLDFTSALQSLPQHLLVSTWFTVYLKIILQQAPLFSKCFPHLLKGEHFGLEQKSPHESQVLHLCKLLSSRQVCSVSLESQRRPIKEFNYT